ncbi:MAG TPA: FG-GAP-like repeat-containing protein [Pirellulales bacterium]|nr:FG-GAP-like repeat-containing protein [Pirellulales bacterium]
MAVPQAKAKPVVLLLVVVALVGGTIGYVLWSRDRLPAPGSARYDKYVEAFQVGLAALDADLPQRAEPELTVAVEIVPDEPAGWANRGLLYLRTGKRPEAARDLANARRLAPNDAQIDKLLGLLEKGRGRYGEAVVYLRKAIDNDPEDVRSLYLLSEVVEQEHKEGSDAERQRLLKRVLELRPKNLRVLADYLRVAVRNSDGDAVRETLATLDNLAPDWLPGSQSELAKVKEKVPAKLGPTAVISVVGLANMLKGEPHYVRDATEVSPEDQLVGDPLREFLRLAPVRPVLAPADHELRFVAEPLSPAPAGEWERAVAVWLTGDGTPAAFLLGGGEIRRLGDEAVFSAPKATDLIAIDWNNDRRNDLLASGQGGLHFYQQQDDGKFDEVTAKLELPDDVLNGRYDGALAADVDLDGDMDLLLARVDDSPLFLRNNFDGTFAPLPIFEGVKGPQRFVWADLDDDGAPDAGLLDESGHLRMFANERSASFVAWPAALPEGSFLAFAIADADDDGVFDLVGLRQDGVIVCISDRNKRSAWTSNELGRWPTPGKEPQAHATLLLAADLDNNGAVDLVASSKDGTAIWLKEHDGRFEQLKSELPPRLQAVADMRGEGRLDLLALDQGGQPVRLVNSGKKDYHWQNIRPEATRDKADGDKRINSFGIGGQIEVCTGTHVVKQPIEAPVVHFGLGQRDRADVTRIVWPNGTFQAEFTTPIDKAVIAVQRLKGSCPFLFAFDGQRIVFVNDFMWSTPLGMYINATDNGGFLQTTDWIKIPGDRLARREGQYELRVNANLWETHFFDHLSLRVVDHPADTEMFVDERFFMRPTSPAFHILEGPQTVAAAWDQEGRDALTEVSEVDGVHLDRAGRGIYQGLTNDHWVEVDLGDDVPGEGPLWLVARGWVHPTDSSINYALSQGKHGAPHALSLEVPDGQGGWKTVDDRLGFPAGKNKTMLIRLDGLDGVPGVARRFRLRTNMEIYWDWLAWARGRDDAEVKQQLLLPETADLRFRGIVEMTQANRSSPELPDYDRLVAVGQHWRDLIGYHTRHGDIRELLETVDDRYAILTAGDEIVLKFAALPDPLPGWKRDFVWISDGWVKDGDYNTRFGKTVLPLPSHDMNNYTTPPGPLVDDPVYRRHPRDWEIYHTRYITPHAFERGLRGPARPMAAARPARSQGHGN